MSSSRLPSPHSSKRSLELESLIAAEPNSDTNDNEEDLSNKANESHDNNGHVAEIVASPLKSTNLQKLMFNKVPNFRQSRMDDWIHNAESEDVATEEEHYRPQISSSAGSNTKNSSDTSSLSLLQVNNMIQDECRARMSSFEDLVVAQLRAEIKDIVKESMTEIQIEQGNADDPPLRSADGTGSNSNVLTKSTFFNIESDGEREQHASLPEDTDTTSNSTANTTSRTPSVTRTISFLTRTALNIESDGEQHVSLPGDTFSLMIVSKAGTSRPWLAGFGIYVIQMALLVFLCLEMFFDGNFLAQFPLKVDPLVSCAQFFVLLAIFFLQADLVEAARNLFVLSDENVRDLANGEDDFTKTRARFMFSNVLKLTMAIITIAVSVALGVRSNTSLELLKDFAALMVISQIDNLVFTLFVKNGLFDLESKKKADEIMMRSVIVDITTRGGKYQMDVLIISCIYFVAVISWIVILVLQFNGTIARAKGCNVNLSRLGDGKCDDGLFNTGVCEWDAGDCVEVNQKYPDCNVLFLSKIGDGECNGGDYNTQLCGWDGGDCCVVADQWRIGDGICNGGDYDIAECGWDGGDCIESDEYPRCRVDVPSQIGNGECDGGDYNTAGCGWDGGDCVVPGYPDCHVTYPSVIGDGECDGGDYNTADCFEDEVCEDDPIINCHFFRYKDIAGGATTSVGQHVMNSVCSFTCDANTI